MMLGTWVLLAAVRGGEASLLRLGRPLPEDEGAARRLATPALLLIREGMALVLDDGRGGGSAGSPTGPVVPGIDGIEGTGGIRLLPEVDGLDRDACATDGVDAEKECEYSCPVSGCAGADEMSLDMAKARLYDTVSSRGATVVVRQRIPYSPLLTCSRPS